jgi:hypothetical protein
MVLIYLIKYRYNFSFSYFTFTINNTNNETVQTTHVDAMLAPVNVMIESVEVKVTQLAYIQKCVFRILIGTLATLNEFFVIFLNLSRQIPE